MLVPLEGAVAAAPAAAPATEPASAPSTRAGEPRDRRRERSAGASGRPTARPCADRDPEDLREHAARGVRAADARALHDERTLGVARGRERDERLDADEPRGRVRRPDRARPDRRSRPAPSLPTAIRAR